ncbi:LysR family transcriptional regulator [Gottfriedia acidiceleris]|uniref:LysR family transcriptional regulator n=1 Tax=Gottfriedia acidiceleris TaxID=371036 RepID=A0ABY4JII3_9BACI|nr:LysR family transcriptional regulator [Gottfriedia acidiceleris]UPM53644.1 LysR family transcriptional regulator [Gottfriedia acidiceleris]
MKIEQLSHLCEVLESGSFTIAAQKFFIKEADMKESIISLEIEFGIELIEYENESKVVPSVGCLQIISHIKEIVRNCREIEEEIKSLHKKSSVNTMYDVCLF